MTTGVEWIVDAYGCRADDLRDGRPLRELCATLIAELPLHVVGEPHWHQFPGPAGWTGLYLLTESHLSCHTFPELGLATFNLYCCRPRPAWDWERNLAHLLGAERVTIRTLIRGGDALVVAQSDAATALAHDAGGGS
jgi:S-adenosylmethionine decarboxylase